MVTRWCQPTHPFSHPFSSLNPVCSSHPSLAHSSTIAYHAKRIFTKTTTTAHNTLITLRILHQSLLLFGSPDPDPSHNYRLILKLFVTQKPFHHIHPTAHGACSPVTIATTRHPPPPAVSVPLVPPSVPAAASRRGGRDARAQPRQLVLVDEHIGIRLIALPASTSEECPQEGPVSL